MKYTPTSHNGSVTPPHATISAHDTIPYSQLCLGCMEGNSTRIRAMKKSEAPRPSATGKSVLPMPKNLHVIVIVVVIVPFVVIVGGTVVFFHQAIDIVFVVVVPSIHLIPTGGVFSLRNIG